jgi:hypothetical protein
MKDIYSNTLEVVVWLGPSIENSNDTISSLKQISKEEFCAYYYNEEDRVKPLIQDESRYILITILSHTWFERI